MNTLFGKLEFKDIGSGEWYLVSPTGPYRMYGLYQAGFTTEGLTKMIGQALTITGEIMDEGTINTSSSVVAKAVTVNKIL